jgi:hypothetical protein
MLKLYILIFVCCALINSFNSQVVITLAGVEVKYSFSSSSTSFTLTVPLAENNLKKENAWVGLGFNSRDVMVSYFYLFYMNQLIIKFIKL